MTDRVVEHDLERPRRRDAHRRLDDHGNEHDDEPCMVGTQKLEDELRRRALDDDSRARRLSGHGNCRWSGLRHDGCADLRRYRHRYRLMRQVGAALSSFATITERAASAAVSARSVRRPKRTGVTPCRSASSRSCGANPPSGPTTMNRGTRVWIAAANEI